MRHRGQVSHFGRRTGQRQGLIRGLVYSLVEHGKIQTTVAKAKELRRHVERAVTMGKKNSLHARRLLMSRYPNPAAVEKILKTWSPHFATRPGGYTRIMKLGPRPGDCAEMAVIEFVDHQKFQGQETAAKVAKSKKAKKPAGEKAAKSAEAPAKKTAAKKAKAKKEE
jgi:large subunit ribosomal protein L17